MKSEAEVFSGCFLWEHLILKLRPLLYVILKKKAALGWGIGSVLTQGTHSDARATRAEPAGLAVPRGSADAAQRLWGLTAQLEARRALGLKNIKRN